MKKSSLPDATRPSRAGAAGKERAREAGGAEKKVRLSLDVPEAMRRRIKIGASDSGLSLTDYCLKIFDEHVPKFTKLG